MTATPTQASTAGQAATPAQAAISLQPEEVRVVNSETAPTDAATRGRRVVFSAVGARQRPRWRVPSVVRRATLPIALIVAWQLGGNAGWWSTDVLPSPADVAREFGTLVANGQLPDNLLVSLKRVLIGASIGIGAGTVLGIAVGLWRPVEEAVDATLQMMRTIPFLVILPLFILWFGVDELPKVLIIAIGTMLPMYLNTSSGIRSVDPKLIEMGERFGLNRLQLIGTVVLPGAMPSLLTGLRYSLGISWLALVVAEQINAQKGLGFLIANAQALFQTRIIMVIVVVYALLGLITDVLVRLAEWRLLAWRHDPRRELTR